MRLLKFLPSRSMSTGIILRNRVNEQGQHTTGEGPAHKSTVDFAEIEQHSKLSNKWWDKTGQLRALHALNPLRVQFVRDGLANSGVKGEVPYFPLQGLKILDVGCGGGILSEPLARIGAEVTGIDASQELIDTAIEHAKKDPNVSCRVNYMRTTVEEFAPTNEESYDAVVASEVIEHVTDKKLFLQNCVDIVRPGGSVFITTMNKTIPSLLGGIIAAEYVFRLVPTGTHDWNKFISPEEMQRLLETCDCKTNLIHGMLYNPLTNRWFWTSCTAIDYALQAVKRKKQQ